MSARDPLFIRFANDKLGAYGIMESFRDSTESRETQDIIDEFLKEEEPSLEQFRSDFRNCLDDIIRNGVDGYVKNYLNNYMQPSLLEYRVDQATRTTGNQKQWVGIKDKESAWMEALVCYNLCMFVKGLDVRALKLCPVCSDYFSHKGRFAKFCSESCKGRNH